MDSERDNALDPFLQRVTGIVEANLSDEQFGVSRLADLLHLSRSQLHRRLRRCAGKSVSQFVRDVRLDKARTLLLETDRTAAEVADEVGFGSASYFSKCFAERYGYPPGKAKFVAATAPSPVTVEVEAVPESTAGQDGADEPSRLRLRWVVWPALLVLLVSASVWWWRPSGRATSEPEPITPSVIVAPFRNLSPGNADAYLTEGIVAAITRQLSGIGELQVKSPTAMAQFAGSRPTPSEIGDRLGVSNVIQGSVQRIADSLRIEIALIRTDDETQVWAKHYDRAFSDILKVQSDIATNVARALEANLSPSEVSFIRKQSTYNAEAFDNFLRGRQNSTNASATAYFKRAIEIDPSMPLGYLGMAAQYFVKTAPFVEQLSTAEACELAGPYLDEAYRLDPRLIEIYGWKGFQEWYCNWDFAAAEKNFQVGIDSPESPFFLFLYATFLHYQNRHAEALEISRRQRSENPYYPVSALILSQYYTGDYAAARDRIEQRLTAYTDYSTLSSAGFFYLNVGEYERALELWSETLKTNGKRLPQVLGWMGATYARLGRLEETEQIIAELELLKQDGDAGAPAFQLAVVYAAVGKSEEAIRWLRVAVDDREKDVVRLVSEPQLYDLHTLPAFVTLVERVGFGPEAFPIQRPTKGS